MAEAIRKTREVEQTIIKTEESVVLTLSPEEAQTIYDILYLTEVQDVESATSRHIRSSLLALGATLNWPTHHLRVDFGSIDNSDHTIYLYERQ